MKDSHLGMRFVTALILVAAGFGFAANGNPYKLAAQEPAKSLDIERYTNEPLELIELKIGEQSIRDKIATKSRRNDEGLDNVRFREKDGWFKTVWVKLRNVSGKPIIGVGALIYFQPQYTKTLFSLPLAGSTHFKQGVLEPGDEIILTVSDQSWTLTSETLRQHGVDPDQALVKFSIDRVAFNDGLQWRRGRLHRRDSENPYKWNVIDTKAP
jgi:hypothetical protein